MNLHLDTGWFSLTEYQYLQSREPSVAWTRLYKPLCWLVSPSVRRCPLILIAYFAISRLAETYYSPFPTPRSWCSRVGVRVNSLVLSQCKNIAVRYQSVKILLVHFCIQIFFLQMLNTCAECCQRFCSQFIIITVVIVIILERMFFEYHFLIVSFSVTRVDMDFVSPWND